MNTAQIEARRRKLADEAAALDADLARMTATKSWSMSAALERRVNALAAERDALDRAETKAEHIAAFRNRIGLDAGSSATAPMPTATKSLSGREANPLVFSEDSLRRLHQAATSRQSVQVKAFSSVGGLLPAQLDPAVLGKIHEARLLDRLPVTPITAPSYEVLVHNSTTGAPGVTAEGGVKPEVVLNMTAHTLAAVKIAAHVGISYETLSDFPAFIGYAHVEMTRQLQDVENAEIIGGSGTGGHMTGFLNTSGILTHDASTDTGTNVTAVDSIEKSIAALRTGTALADADLLVLHPGTWSAIRRLKDTVGRFLFISGNDDPTTAQANSIFGVPVLVTTAISPGAGLLLDTTKFGRVLVRDSITIHTGQNADDFSRNLTRFVLEERLVLAVERPAAVLSLTNLPTA